MRPKKYPKADLNPKSSFFFVTGLLLVLFMTLLVLEWKTYPKPIFSNMTIAIDHDLAETLPLVRIKLPPPPLPLAVPETIALIENDDPIVETLIKPTEPGPDEAILDIPDIPVAELPEDDPEVPFVLIEDAPVFPGCEDAGDKKNCFQKMMRRHIQKVFRYPRTAQDLGLDGRVYTTFTIQKDGSIGDLRLRGPHKSLEAEAARIIKTLPKMIPGKQRGVPVRVPFSMPITFRLP